MGALEDVIGGKGAPRKTRAPTCCRKQSVELFLFYIFLEKYTSKLQALKAEA